MKKLSFIIVLVAVALNVNGQLLWKVSGNKLKSPSYIFGTHHVAPISIIDSIKGFQQAYNSCKQLYGEVDMTDMADIQAHASLYMVAPQDSTIDKIYSPEDFKTVADGIQKYMNVDVAQVAMLKPAAISTSISMLLAMKVFPDFNPTQQLDAVLQQRATENGMTINGLETATFQLNLLFNAPLKEQADDLLKFFKDENVMIEFTRLLAEDYMRQDLPSLLTHMLDPQIGSTEAQMQRLIYDRNKNWMQQLPDIMKNSPTFFVVGAGHLVGEHGVLTMLRKNGYKVTAVK